MWLADTLPVGDARRVASSVAARRFFQNRRRALATSQGGLSSEGYRVTRAK